MLLYELLTGTTPFERKTAACGGVRRNAADHPRGGAAQAQHAAQYTRPSSCPTVAANRSSDPSRLSQVVPRRAGLDRDEGAGKGPQPPLRDGQRPSPPTFERYLNDEPVRPARRRPRTASASSPGGTRRHFLHGAAVAVAMLVAVGSLISGVVVLATSNATSATNNSKRNRP